MSEYYDWANQLWSNNPVLGMLVSLISLVFGIWSFLGKRRAQSEQNLATNALNTEALKYTAVISDNEKLQTRLKTEQAKAEEQLEVARLATNQNVAQSGELASQRKELDNKQLHLDEINEKMDALRNTLASNDGELWSTHDYDLMEKQVSLSDPDRIILTVANLKGGVGKSTISGNLACYFADQNKRVLLIDLDYQGSLSGVVLAASGLGTELIEDGKRVDPLLKNGAQPSDLLNLKVDIREGIPQASLLPTDYSLAQLENRLFVSYLFGDEGTDVRFRLADILLTEEAKSLFDVIILDVPPRMTAGTINALATSTHFLVPTVADPLSALAIGTFLTHTQRMKPKLNPRLRLLGIVPSMTYRAESRTNREEKALRQALVQAQGVWRDDAYIFESGIPHRAAFPEALDNEKMAYYMNEEVKGWFDAVGDTVVRRIHETPASE